MVAKAKPRKSVYFVAEGVVERADLETRDPFHRNFYAMGETKEYYLSVALKLDDGRAVYFNTAPATRTVVSVCGEGIAAAVVTYRVEGGAKQWLREERGETGGVATPGVPNDNKVVPLVKVGDRVRVMGRVKAHKESRRGNVYVSLTHVERDPHANATSDPLPPLVRYV